MLVESEEDLVRVLRRVYAAMSLPFRPESVGSLRRAGTGAALEEVNDPSAAEASLRYAPSECPSTGRRGRWPEGVVRRTWSARRGSSLLRHGAVSTPIGLE